VTRRADARQNLRTGLGMSLCVVVLAMCMCVPSLSRAQITAIPVAPDTATTASAVTTTAPAATTPAAAPATTAPAATQAVVAPAAEPLLAALCDAYAKIGSMELEGEMSGEFDIDGREVSASIRFRSISTREVGFLHESDDATVSAGPSRLLLYLPGRSVYLRYDRPERTLTYESVPSPLGRVLLMQNPALVTAMSADPRQAILAGESEVQRGEDLTIDGRVFPSLVLVGDSGSDDTRLVIDPETNLLRRVEISLDKFAAGRGAKEIRSASVTIDYTKIELPAQIAAERFDWQVPEGTRQVYQPPEQILPFPVPNPQPQPAPRQ